MLLTTSSSCPLKVTVLLWLGVAAVSISFAQNQVANENSRSTAGGSIFDSSCAGCHGLDGRGSDKAPGIAGNPSLQHLSDADVTGIISQGLPDSGMPAFRDLNQEQIRNVVGYVRSLQGSSQSPAIPGDSKHGREVFFGKGECSTCHTVSGQGGFLGPDLSLYGSSASPQSIRDQIVKPKRIPAEGYRPAVLTTASGEHLRGVVRNEDNFSLQLQTDDGAFHFFQKSDLRNIEHLDASLMPTNYREKLSASELDDLVNFLVHAAPEAGTERRAKKNEDFDE